MRDISWLRAFVAVAVLVAGLSVIPEARAQSIDIVEVTPAGPVFTGDTINVRVRAVPSGTPGNLPAKLTVVAHFENNTPISGSPPVVSLAGGEYLFEYEFDVPTRLRCDPRSCTPSITPLSDALRSRMPHLKIKVAVLDGAKTVASAPERQIPVNEAAVIDIQPVRQPLHSRQLVRITMADARFTEADIIKVHLTHTEELRRLWYGTFRPDRPTTCRTPIPVAAFVACDGRVINDTTIELNVQSFAQLLDNEDNTDVDHIGVHDLLVTSQKTNSFRREAVRFNAYTFDPPQNDELATLDRLGLRIGSGETVVALPGLPNQYVHDFAADPDVDVSVTADGMYKLTGHRQANLWLLAKDESGGGLLQSVPGGGNARATISNTVGETLPKQWKLRLALPGVGGNVEFKLVATRSDMDDIAEAENNALFSSPPIRVYFGTGTPPVGQDSISLSNPVPPDLSNLESESMVTFSADVAYSLQTADNGFVELRLMDQSGNYPKTTRQAVSKGNGVVSLSTGPVALPAGVTGLYLKAALLDDGENLLETVTGAEYTVSPPLDVVVDRIEVVQVTQDESNSIPLILGKATVARVFAKLAKGPDEIRGVGMHLRGYANGAELPGSPRWAPPAYARITQVRKEPEGRFHRHSYNFRLPKPWLQHEQLTLRAEADPEDELEETDNGNNQLEQTFSFQRPRKFTVKYWPVCMQLPGQAKICPGEKVASAGYWLPRLYPLAASDFSYSALNRPPLIWPYDLKDGGSQNGLSIYLRKMFQFMTAQAGGLIGFDQLVGWVPNKTSGGLLGLSDPKWASGGGRSVFVQDITATSRWKASVTMAHELAHNLGLRHPNTVDACGAKDQNTDWPYIDAMIQHYGYSPLSGGTIYATNWDFMSYCGFNSGWVWISPFHYRKLIASDFLPQPSVAGREGSVLREAEASPVDPAPRRASGELAIVSGVARADGTAARLSPLYRVTSGASTEASDPAGQYCLRFEGSGTNPADHCFNISFQNHETWETLDEAGFSVLVPWDSETSRVALLRGGQSLSTLAASANPPQVAFTSPGQGEQWMGGESRTVAWSGSDLDGDSLMYSLMYAHDGGTNWLPLAMDITSTSYTFDTAQIRGGSSVFFRVLASDGFLVATATSGPVTLTQASSIGIAPDPFDLLNVTIGEVREDSLTIRNDGSGPLTVNSISGETEVFQVVAPVPPFSVQAGAERAVVVQFAPPSEGVHSATLSVTSDASRQPQVTVSLNGTGVADLDPEIEVSPAVLDLGQVAVGGSSSAAALIRNRGPGDLTVQSFASGNSAFQVDPLAGPVELETGATLTVTVRFSPSTAGAQTGTLTIATSDPDNPAVEITLTGSASSGGGGGTVAPAINAGGVVDAASFQIKVSPGGLASIFGDVGTAPAFAEEVPLPRQLGGVQVTVNGFSAPLVYVSAGQINFQIPFEVQPGNAKVVVIRNGVSSPPQTVEVRQFAPGFFTYSGTNMVIAQRPDLSLVTAENPAVDGEGLVFYVTGLGGLHAPPTTGAPASGAPLSTSVVPPTMTVGGADANVFFAGLTPYFIGLGQINAYMPNPMPAAAAHGDGTRKADSATLPVVIDFNGNKSQVVELPVEASEGPGPTDGDITVAIDKVTPVSVRPNETFTVDFRITSAEQLNQEVTWLVYLSDDSNISSLEDQMLKTQKVQHTGVSSGVKTPPILMPGDRSPGTYYVGVIVLGGDNDSFGNNISAGLPIEVAGAPVTSSDGEVAVTIRQVVPTSLRAGEKFTVDFTITSAGPLVQEVTWLVYLSEDADVNPIGDEMLKTQKVNYTGTSMDVTTPAVAFPADRSPGLYYVGVVILGGDNDSFGNNMSAGLPVDLLASGGG